MSQFDLPPDDFDLAFDDTPRRNARPQTNSPASQAKTRRKSEPPRAGKSRASGLDVFDDDFDFAPPKPRRATNTKTNGKTRPKTVKAPTSPRKLRAVHYEVLGVLLLAFGGLLGYYSLQSSIDGALPRALLGGLRLATGIGAVIIPLLLAYLGILLIIKRGHANLRSFWRGAGVALLVILTAKALTVPRGAEWIDAEIIRAHGGYIGAGIAWALRRALGELGAVVTLLAFGVVALLLWTEHTVAELGEDLRAKMSDWGKTAKTKWKAEATYWKQERAHRAQEKANRPKPLREYFDEDENDVYEDEPAAEQPRRALPRRVVEEARENSERASGERENVRAERANERVALPPRAPKHQSPFLPIEDLLEIAPIDGRLMPVKVSENRDQSKIENGAPPAISTPSVDRDSLIEAPKFERPRVEYLDSAPPVSVVDNAPVIDLKAVVAGENADRELTPTEALEAQAQLSATSGEIIKAPKVMRPEKPRRSFGDGPLMPEYFDDGVRALDPPVPPDNAGAEEEIAAGVEGVQETLASFKIDARVTDVKRGPVITRYEVQPGLGVRVNTIANLDKDLARALSALTVRIEAPVPGKNVVGIEIPNKKVHLVRMRDVLEQPEFLAHPSKLAFVLGKDIAGQPKWGDLTKMPHMLIAGATNSGKSVCLNSIITSILVRARPDEVRFSLIDPKRVELTLYRGIRHLMHDVVVEPKQAVVALRRAIEEMDRRYKLFAARGVRNIVSFNAKLKEGEKPLPYIVIVIDELADLMMTAAAEFEKLICRLAQLARATGIHLIVATQRPSVNVITGVIKANIPARIAFAVASQVDSRTILDSVGAERLIGSGDMLYDSNNGGKSVRIQGAFLSEEEVNRVVEVVKAAYQYDDDDEFDDLPEFDLFVPDDDDEGADYQEMADEKKDALYDEIVEFVKRHQEMSASNIQRKFGIGYPRAGRIVDQLERHGIVGPADGPKARKVLAQRDDDE